MNKTKNNVKNNVKKEKNNKVIIGIILAVVIVAIAVIVVVVKNQNGGVSIELDTEVWLNVGETATLKNGNDKITLKIDSDLNYVEGEEYEVPYILTVNDAEYNGTYTFATGYSIHSEPNNIPYKVSFTGIKEGSVGVMVSEK